MLYKSVYRIATVALTLLIASSCKDDKNTVIKEKVEVSFKKEGILQLKETDSDSIIQTLDIEIADNEYETQTGLMYRTTLGVNQGMLFIFPDVSYRSFYMKNTKIPLDIIYIAEDKTIVSFQKNAKPLDESSLPSDAPAKYVLEINGGLSEEWQLELGDRIDFEITQ